MKKSLTLALITFASMSLGAQIASAHCGGCGTGNSHADKHSHSHAEQASMSPASELSIYETAKAAGFETLIAAVQAAGLEKALIADGPFTVFAPTDAAFAKLPKGALEALIADPEALKGVLLYHVVSGAVSAGDVVKLTSAQTLTGASVNIESGKGVKINGANVIKTDIMTSNGVIHVIDSVLMP